jgi:hypothetical protein
MGCSIRIAVNLISKQFVNYSHKQFVLYNLDAF